MAVEVTDEQYETYLRDQYAFYRDEIGRLGQELTARQREGEEAKRRLDEAARHFDGTISMLKSIEQQLQGLEVSRRERGGAR